MTEHSEERRSPRDVVIGASWRVVDDLGDPQGRIALIGLLVIAVLLGSLAWSMQHLSFDIWGGLLVMPVLIAVSLPAIWLLTRRDEAPMVGLLWTACVLKILAAVPRYFVVFAVYGGNADAELYSDVARQLSDAFRDGHAGFMSVFPHTVGTRFIVELSGLVYTLLGPTKLGGFVVFSWLGFWGLFLMHRAALIGFPDLDQRRYAIYLFFLPSLLFWPSSMGKEAWLMLSLGVSCYGAARFLARRRLGITITALGCVLTGMVRPHVSVLIVAALGIAFIVRRSEDRGSVGAPIRKVAGIAVLVVGITFALSWTDRLLGTGEGKASGISLSKVLDRTSEQTSTGGSEFTAERPNSPLEYPVAFLTVMFRPSMLDARSVTQMLSALETTALAAIFVLSIERLRGAFRLLLKEPYLLFCTVYSGMFAFAWSSIGNFGILVRQRSLAWPLFLIVLAVPLARQRSVLAESGRARRRPR